MSKEISLVQIRTIRYARHLCSEADLSVKNLLSSSNIVYFTSLLFYNDGMKLLYNLFHLVF